MPAAPRDPKLYSSVELSPNEFNARVSLPAHTARLERVRFHRISCRSLDSFFEVRGGVPALAES